MCKTTCKSLLHPVLVFLWLLPGLPLWAQNQSPSNVDQLLKQLETAKPDTNRVNLLEKIVSAYTANDKQNKRKMMQYASQELELSRSLGWIKGQVNALEAFGKVYGMNSDLEKFAMYFKEAYELAKKNRLTDKQYSLQFILASYYEANKDYEAALTNLKAVLEYYLKFRPKDVDTSGGLISNIWRAPAFEVGRIYSILKKDTVALKLYQNILNRFTKENDSLGIRTTLHLLMHYHYNFMKDYDGSRKYCFEELKYFKKGDTTTKHATVISYIADGYRLQKNYVKALEYYRTAMALNPDASIYIRNSANKGMRLIYFQLGDYGKALNLDLEQLHDVTQMDDNYIEMGKINLYNNLADDYNNLKQYDQSLLYLNKELDLSDRYFDKGVNPGILLSLANLYYLTHRYDEALVKIKESTSTLHFEKNEFGVSLSLLYKGKIIRDAPDDVLRKYGVQPGKKYQESARMLQKALLYFTSNNVTDYLQECYKELSATYDSMNDYENFYSTYKKYIVLRDSSVNRENQNAFISKVADIQFEKKEDSLKYQQRLANDKLTQQTLLTVSELLTPQQLVDELHCCFKAFDEIIGKYRIEKIKTIGDAYLAVAGLPNTDPQHASNTVHAALEIRQFVHERKERMGDKSFDIRVGLHSGSVVAGIVGVKKFAYDIWGDTVNTAARMEQHSMPGQINLSEKTYELVKDQFAFTYRGEIEAKNKGALKMYFVEKQSAAMPVSS